MYRFILRKALMSTHSQRDRARPYRIRRRSPALALRTRARPRSASVARLAKRIAYVPLMCSLFNGRAADRISVGRK